MGGQDGDGTAHFAALLSQTESDEDVQKLYPRSIWDHDNTNPRDQTQENTMVAEGSQFADLNGLVIRDFVVYNSIRATQSPGVFVSLSSVALQCRTVGKAFSIDGYIVNQNTGHRKYVTGMRICDVTIGGFDTALSTTSDSIWVQTVVSKPYKMWYRLADAAPEYRNIWDDFTWLSDFAKYLFHYLAQQTSHGRSISLATFRTQFLAARFERGVPDDTFQAWHQKTGRCHDLGKHLVRHGVFLKSLATAMDSGGDLLAHPIWDDIMQQYFYTQPGAEQTVVTPYVARGFLTSFPKWDAASNGGLFDLLRTRAVDHCLATKRERRRTQMRFATVPDQLVGSDSVLQVEQLCSAFDSSHPTIHVAPQDLIHKIIMIRQKRLIHIKDSSHVPSKMAIVTGVAGNQKMLRVRWLVTPIDAIDEMCGGASTRSPQENRAKAYYPSLNELYLSDNCSCHTVSVLDVQAAFKVSLLTNNASSPIFIRKRYRAHDQAIIDVTMPELERICHDPACPRSGTLLELRSAAARAWAGEVPPIHNISMFSGCGLFDEGLENEPSIHTKHSFDSNIHAVKSIQVNRSADPSHEIQHKCVNRWMRELLDGKQAFTGDDFVEKVLMLSAGCSCCGWSLINSMRQNKEGQRQCSFLASVISAVETILPQFVVIENVPAMAGRSLGGAQAVALLSGLGYQVRICKLRAHDYGASTKRQRLFILAAAPGLELPDLPSPTHGEDCANKYVTIKDVIGHLPPVDNDAWINVAYPDHIPLHRWNTRINEATPAKQVSLRHVGRRIPKQPRGMNLARSRHLLTSAQQVWFDHLRNEVKLSTSAAFRRMHPDEQFHTILTIVYSLDGRSGAMVHYEQDRTITLEETRIAQGVPHHWILIGNMSEQQRQVGNAVPFALGTAVGRVIGDAWRRSHAGRQHDVSDSIHDINTINTVNTVNTVNTAASEGKGEGKGEGEGVDKGMPLERNFIFTDESDSEIEYLGTRKVIIQEE